MHLVNRALLRIALLCVAGLGCGRLETTFGNGIQWAHEFGPFANQPQMFCVWQELLSTATPGTACEALNLRGLRVLQFSYCTSTNNPLPVDGIFVVGPSGGPVISSSDDNCKSSDEPATSGTFQIPDGSQPGRYDLFFPLRPHHGNIRPRGLRQRSTELQLITG